MNLALIWPALTASKNSTEEPGADAAATLEAVVAVSFSLAEPLRATAPKAIANKPNAYNQLFRFIVATREVRIQDCRCKSPPFSIVGCEAKSKRFRAGVAVANSGN